MTEKIGDVIVVIRARGFEGLNEAQARVMSETEHIELLEINPATQHLVTTPAGEHAKVESFALLEGISYVPLMLIDQVVTQLDRIKNSEASETITTLLDLDPIEAAAFLELNAVLESGELRLAITFELDVVQRNPGTGKHPGQKVQLHLS